MVCNGGAETQKAAERDAAIISGESLVDYNTIQIIFSPPQERTSMNKVGCLKTSPNKRQIKKMIWSGRLSYNHKPVPKSKYGNPWNPNPLISNNLILGSRVPPESAPRFDDVLVSRVHGYAPRPRVHIRLSRGCFLGISGDLRPEFLTYQEWPSFRRGMKKSAFPNPHLK